MEDLIAQVKQLIVEGLHLDHVGADQIGDDQQLFGGELGLDSVDALELVLEVERHFGVTIRDDEEGRAVLKSPASLAAYIKTQRVS